MYFIGILCCLLCERQLLGWLAKLSLLFACTKKGRGGVKGDRLVGLWAGRTADIKHTTFCLQFKTF